ncbi:MAG: ABC transporter substrate-binding protein, partial [Proteobacteria bacterium]|nr:ABC transporter substrate-binding protein [Pseudomonadota bacterium]
IQTLRIPTLVAFALEPAIRKPPNRYEFHLFGGLTAQVQALLTYAAGQIDPPPQRPAVIYLDESPWSGIAERIAKHSRSLGWEDVVTVALPSRVQSFDPLPTVDELRDKKIDLLVLLAPEHSAHLVRAAATRSWAPTVLVPGILSTDILESSAPQTGPPIYVSLPSVPTDRGERARNALSELQERAGISHRFLAAQVNALATAVLLIEGLKRSGRALSREKLVDVMAGIYDFNTGLTPPVSYGPNRRIGARGSYVYTLNRSTGQLVAASGWIDSDP